MANFAEQLGVWERRSGADGRPPLYCGRKRRYYSEASAGSLSTYDEKSWPL